MLCLSPHLLIAAARALVGTGMVTDTAPALTRSNDDAGAAPLRERARPSWDLAFVQHCGYWSHRDAGTGQSSWPIPAGISLSELAAFGTTRGIMYTTPDVGDIFLQYGPSRKTFVHVGIVMAVLGSGQFCPKTPYFDVYTVEGDTGAHGRLHGGLTLRVRRRLNPGAGDRFLAWMEIGYAQQLASSLSFGEARQTRCA